MKLKNKHFLLITSFLFLLLSLHVNAASSVYLRLSPSEICRAGKYKFTFSTVEETNTLYIRNGDENISSFPVASETCLTNGSLVFYISNIHYDSRLKITKYDIENNTTENLYTIKEYKQCELVDIIDSVLYFRIIEREGTDPGKLYAYDLEKNMVQTVSSNTIPCPVQKTATIKDFLQTALKPVGSTNYVWKGGHDDINSTRIGLNPAWNTFFAKQDSSYKWKNTKYLFDDGLDCSGYVSWTLYNTLYSEKHKKSLLCLAKKMPSLYEAYGWGTIESKESITEYKAGDLMFCTDPSHICIILGKCKDNSVILLHSSPPGVQISGTATPEGKRNSQAVKLAAAYMKRYFPEWYQKYPKNSRNKSYLTDYNQFHWNLAEDGIFTDPDNLQDMTPEEVLEIIFEN